MDLASFWIYNSSNQRSPFTPSWVEAYRRLCGEPNVTQATPINYCLPNGTQLLLTQSIGIQNRDFGATPSMPIGPSGSWLPINLSVFSDLSNGMTIAHELGHQLYLPHCEIQFNPEVMPPLVTPEIESLFVCSASDLMYAGALTGQQPSSSSNLTPLQIRTARATALKLAGIKQ
jgi:hypothetical protein